MQHVEPVFFSEDNFSMLHSLMRDTLQKRGGWDVAEQQDAAVQSQLLSTMQGVFRKNAHLKVDIPISQVNMILNKEVLETSLKKLSGMASGMAGAGTGTGTSGGLPVSARPRQSRGVPGVSVMDAYAQVQERRKEKNVIRTGMPPPGAYNGHLQETMAGGDTTTPFYGAVSVATAMPPTTRSGCSNSSTSANFANALANRQQPVVPSSGSGGGNPGTGALSSYNDGPSTAMNINDLFQTSTMKSFADTLAEFQDDEDKAHMSARITEAQRVAERDLSDAQFEERKERLPASVAPQDARTTQERNVYPMDANSIVATLPTANNQDGVNPFSHSVGGHAQTTNLPSRHVVEYKPQHYREEQITMTLTPPPDTNTTPSTEWTLPCASFRTQPKNIRAVQIVELITGEDYSTPGVVVHIPEFTSKNISTNERIQEATAMLTYDKAHGEWHHWVNTSNVKCVFNENEMNTLPTSLTVNINPLTGDDSTKKDWYLVVNITTRVPVQ